MKKKRTVLGIQTPSESNAKLGTSPSQHKSFQGKTSLKEIMEKMKRLKNGPSE